MKTQRVRILVLVARDGSYNASGAGVKGEHDEKPDYMADCLPYHVNDSDYHEVWVEADVPLPLEIVVEGEAQ